MKLIERQDAKKLATIVKSLEANVEVDLLKEMKDLIAERISRSALDGKMSLSIDPFYAKKLAGRYSDEVKSEVIDQLKYWLHNNGYSANRDFDHALVIDWD